MDKYFKLPTGYTCLQRNGDNIYAYTTDLRTRDTYELDNFQYVKVASNTNSYGFTLGSCLPTDMAYLIPSSFAPSAFLAASLFICVLVIGLFNVFKR